MSVLAQLVVIVAQWRRGQMICNSAILTVIITMLMIMIFDYDNDCGTVLCSMFVLFGSMNY